SDGRVDQLLDRQRAALLLGAARRRLRRDRARRVHAAARAEADADAAGAGTSTVPRGSPARRNLPVRVDWPNPGAKGPRSKTTRPATSVAVTARSLRLTMRERPPNSGIGASW